MFAPTLGLYFRKRTHEHHFPFPEPRPQPAGSLAQPGRRPASAPFKKAEVATQTDINVLRTKSVEVKKAETRGANLFSIIAAPVSTVKATLLSIIADARTMFTGGNPQMALAGMGRVTRFESTLRQPPRAAEVLNKSGLMVDQGGRLHLTASVNSRDVDLGSTNACQGLRVHKASQGTAMAVDQGAAEHTGSISAKTS